MDIYRSIYDEGKPQWRFTLGVRLKDSPVEVYREVVVPSNIHLPHLCELLLRAMGWEGYHFYEMQKGDDLYASKESIREYKGWNNGEPDPTKYHDYTCYILHQLLRQPGDSFEFRYDLGDDWKHEVTLLEKAKWEPRQHPDFYVIGGEGGCPPEDVGGVGGYAYVLDLLEHPDKDPEEAESYLRWLPEGFDPHYFDLRCAQLRIIDYYRVVRTFTERW